MLICWSLRRKARAHKRPSSRAESSSPATLTGKFGYASNVTWAVHNRLGERVKREVKENVARAAQPGYQHGAFGVARPQSRVAPGISITAVEARRGKLATLRGRILSVVGTALVVGLLTACGLAESGGGDGAVTLRLSHQWPAASEGEGDFRAVLAQRFAQQVKERTNGDVTIKIYPNNSLIEDPEQQYQAMEQGTTDMSVFPLDYASGDVPAFSITLMPAMVRNHAQAQNWQDAEIGREVEKMTEENGIKVLTWIWNAGEDLDPRSEEHTSE